MFHSQDLAGDSSKISRIKAFLSMARETCDFARCFHTLKFFFQLLFLVLAIKVASRLPYRHWHRYSGVLNDRGVIAWRLGLSQGKAVIIDNGQTILSLSRYRYMCNKKHKSR